MNSGKLNKKRYARQNVKVCEEFLLKNMLTEQDLENKKAERLEFAKLIDKDFSERKIKENQIVKAKIMRNLNSLLYVMLILNLSLWYQFLSFQKMN